VPVEFLSDVEAAAYGRFDGSPLREDLDRVFFLDDADRRLIDKRRGEFSVLVVWAVDRLCRQGIEELLRLIRELRERNVSLVSHQEPWLNGTDATTELLAAVAAWVATQESVRRSERIRAGLARRRAQGKPMGGGASKRGKDKRPRRTDGYKQAWARRKASQ
jgi:DNA invertase Pin-like site-specific DNA recombinase